MIFLACKARRTVYVPEDPSDRRVMVVPDCTPHTHPTPLFAKASQAERTEYRRCVEASGMPGATVARVDHGIYIFNYLTSQCSCLLA